MCGSDTHGKADRKNFSTVPSETNEKTEYDILGGNNNGKPEHDQNSPEGL
jgi:hypothetical protein